MLQRWIYSNLFNHILIVLVLVLITNFVFYKDKIQIKLQFNLIKFILLLTLWLNWQFPNFTVISLLKQSLFFVSFLIIVFWEANWFNARYSFKIETLILFLLSTASMILLVTSLDLILIYILLETQGLVVYTLLSITRVKDINFSIEASLKYFILGGIISSMLLIGTSLLYSSLGSTNLIILSKIYSNNVDNNLLLNLSIILILLTVLFKIGMAPFHAWSIDVSKASPNFILAYILTSRKIRLIAIILNLDKFISFTEVELNFLLKFQIVISILIGSYGGINQLSLPKVLVFSSIITMALIVTGLVYSSVLIVKTYAIIYFLFYTLLITTILGTLSLLFKYSSKSSLNNQYINSNLNLKDLQGLDLNSRNNLLGFGFLLFNLIGVRRLMGFYLKFYLLLNIFDTDLILLGSFILIVGIISVIFYLRLIKQLYQSL